MAFPNTVTLLHKSYTLMNFSLSILLYCTVFELYILNENTR